MQAARRTRKQRIRALAGYLCFLGLSTAFVFVLLELALRLFFGLPQGIFNIRPPDHEHLYHPGSTTHFVWTPIPYTVEVNQLGFRGPEIEAQKPPGLFRIIALGDSITDGFYVENEHTYPYQLEARLREKGCPVEVVNVARGWSGIDVEFEMLKKFGMPLQPDLVVLTFVSNDIEEIRGKSREALLASAAFTSQPADTSEWLLFGRTAIGELILDASMRQRFDTYRRNKGLLSGEAAECRYVIPGGDNFIENSRIYLEKFSKAFDSIAWYEQFGPKQEALVENHCWMLRQMNAYCRDRGLPLVLVYYPDYPEIYLPERRFPVSGYLEATCQEEGIPFLNLLPAFREAGNEVLHLAPLDFHPNPKGNALIARTIAAFLQARGLLEKAP